MSRIRSVKPEFFTSQSIAQLDYETRLCFIGLWTEADDYGRLIDSAKLLAGSLFPYDEQVTELRVASMLEVLAAQEMITRYTINGRRYFEVVNWELHQKVSHRSKSNIPDRAGTCPEGNRTKTGARPDKDRSASGPRARAGINGSMDHGSMDHGIGASKIDRRTRVPTDYAVTSRMRTWASEHCTGSDPDACREAFIDYHKSKGSLYTDWDAAFRTWLRNDQKFTKASANGHNKSYREIAAEVAAEMESK